MKQTNQNFLPFALPDIGEEEISAVVDCMRSNWLTSGPKTKEFEEKFAAFLGGGDIQAIAINSATAGLTIALEACGIKEGDEVITTPYTFSATAMSAVYLGATPVLVDIDPITMNINPKLIERAITKKTKAIIPVHFAGLPAEMNEIISIARKHNLKVIEDAAHALPCLYKNKLIGTLDTDATIYSFYATKTITTGEGGMLVTKNPDIARRARIMRLHGISSDAFDRYTSTKPKWYYEITAPGYKCNLTDIASSIGIPQLEKAYSFQKKRRQIHNKYMDSFKDLPVILPYVPEDGELQHAHHLFVLRLKDNSSITRDDFIIKMSQEYKIGCSVHFIPLNLHPFWQEKLNISASDFPISVDSYQRAVSLPIYTKMNDEDINRVINAVRGIFSKS